MPRKKGYPIYQNEYQPRQNGLRCTTHAFCMREGVWQIIKNYAIENNLSYSHALCVMVTEGYAKMKQDEQRRRI